MKTISRVALAGFALVLVTILVAAPAFAPDRPFRGLGADSTGRQLRGSSVCRRIYGASGQ